MRLLISRLICIEDYEPPEYAQKFWDRLSELTSAGVVHNRIWYYDNWDQQYYIWAYAAFCTESKNSNNWIYD